MRVVGVIVGLIACRVEDTSTDVVVISVLVVMRVGGMVVGLIACWVEGTSTDVVIISVLVVMRVGGMVVGLIACWLEGTSTDVVDGVTDGHTSSISCTTVPAVRDRRCLLLF